MTTPLTRRVASICSLCASTVYIVLLGSPTGSITSITERNTYRSCVASSLPLRGNTDADTRHHTLIEDVSESSAGKSKKSNAAPLATNKVSTMEDGMGDTFTISDTLDGK